MRGTRGCAVTLALLGLLAAGEARAQFANSSLTLSVGYLSLGDPSVTGGVPIGIGYTRYLDDGFEFTLRIAGMILAKRGASYLVVGGEGGPGIRYLFLQEEFRPYAGLEVSFRFITDTVTATESTSAYFFGVGPVVGFDYFFTDQFSLGARAQFDVYMMLNVPVQLGGGAAVVAAVYF